jgi:hypothetical protein
MRHLRTALGLVVAVCALGVTAASAFAHEFVASKYNTTISEATPVKTYARSEPETMQEFLFGKYRIKCGKAYGKGIITAASSTNFSTKVQYGKCGFYPFATSEVHFGAVIRGGIQMNLHVNGAAELEGNESGEELEYGTKAELRETSAKFEIPGKKFCTVIVPTQQISAKAIKHPEEEFNFVSYANDPITISEPTATQLKLFPGGVQHKLIISLDLRQIKYRFSEETQCGELETKIEHGNGKALGNLVQEVVSGNLEFH